MSDHDNERQLDEELSAMTDAFLRNPDMTAPPLPADLRRYDEIVRALHAFLNDTGPSADFGQRLAQRLDHEWIQFTARRAESKWWNKPVAKVLTIAAALVLFILPILLLLPPAISMAGSVIGEFGTVFLTCVTIFVVALLSGLIIWIIWRRR